MAREIKVSTRTVKRRVTMMMSSSAFFMQPLIDLRKTSGVTPSQLIIESSPERKRAIDEAVESRFQHIVFTLKNSETHSMFTILCSNIPEMKEAQGWARTQAGVKLARMDILEQQVYLNQWLEQEVGRRIPTKGEFEPQSKLVKPELQGGPHR